MFPFICRRFAGRFGQVLGRIALVVVRSTPEYMLVYVLLQLLGPSMLPAIIALSLRNGAIVGYYIDAAISEFRLDVAVVLILVTALLSMAVDALSRGLRRRLRIDTMPTRLEALTGSFPGGERSRSLRENVHTEEPIH